MNGDVWRIELSDEVAAWLNRPPPRGVAQAFRAIDRLRELEPAIRMPHSRRLQPGLWELGFRCGDVDQRITYTLAPGRRAATLTQFRKQRENERVRSQTRSQRAQEIPGGAMIDYDTAREDPSPYDAR